MAAPALPPRRRHSLRHLAAHVGHGDGDSSADEVSPRNDPSSIMNMWSHCGDGLFSTPMKAEPGQNREAAPQDPMGCSAAQPPDAKGRRLPPFAPQGPHAEPLVQAIHPSALGYCGLDGGQPAQPAQPARAGARLGRPVALSPEELLAGAPHQQSLLDVDSDLHDPFGADVPKTPETQPRSKGYGRWGLWENPEETLLAGFREGQGRFWPPVRTSQALGREDQPSGEGLGRRDEEKGDDPDATRPPREGQEQLPSPSAAARGVDLTEGGKEKDEAPKGAAGLLAPQQTEDKLTATSLLGGLPEESVEQLPKEAHQCPDALEAQPAAARGVDLTEGGKEKDEEPKGAAGQLAPQQAEDKPTATPLLGGLPEESVEQLPKEARQCPGAPPQTDPPAAKRSVADALEAQPTAAGGVDLTEGSKEKDEEPKGPALLLAPKQAEDKPAASPLLGGLPEESVEQLPKGAHQCPDAPPQTAPPAKRRRVAPGCITEALQAGLRSTAPLQLDVGAGVDLLQATLKQARLAVHGGRICTKDHDAKAWATVEKRKARLAVCLKFQRQGGSVAQLASVSSAELFTPKDAEAFIHIAQAFRTLASLAASFTGTQFHDHCISASAELLSTAAQWATELSEASP